VIIVEFCFLLARSLITYFPTYRPVSYAILAVCAFQFVVAVINLMIMCFTPRDDLEKILIKSGTLAAAKSSTE
jgi:hypothetical protein